MAAGLNLKSRYRLDLLPLAGGGMGQVYPAVDLLFNRRVIVKFVNPVEISTDTLRRFQREAELTALLRHPAVPAVYDLDVSDGRPYLVMEYIDGTPLSDLVAEHGPLPLGWVCAIGAQVCGVLISADELGVIHRDIKPSNIMIEPSGAIRVLDFGVAAIHGDDRYSRITRTGESPGTLVYMAPEQITSQPCTHQTDLYGLAITLFELLTGKPPADGATSSIVQHRLQGPIPRPSLFKSDLPAEVDDVLHAMLATDPADRPEHASEVFEVLTRFVDELPILPGVTTGELNGRNAYNMVLGLVCPPRRVAGATRSPRTGTFADVRRQAGNLLEAGDAEGALSVLEGALGINANVPATASRDLLKTFDLYATALRRAGQLRAAARQRRRIAQRYEELGGAGDLHAFECRLLAARIHVDLGEPDRAANLFNTLLRERIRIDGPEHERVARLREEISRR